MLYIRLKLLINVPGLDHDGFLLMAPAIGQKTPLIFDVGEFVDKARLGIVKSVHRMPGNFTVKVAEVKPIVVKEVKVAN